MAGQVRYGLVVDVPEPGVVVVSLDGLDVRAWLLNAAAVPTGDIVTLVQDGRRLVAVGSASAIRMYVLCYNIGNVTTTVTDSMPLTDEFGRSWVNGPVPWCRIMYVDAGDPAPTQVVTGTSDVVTYKSITGLPFRLGLEGPSASTAHGFTPASWTVTRTVPGGYVAFAAINAARGITDSVSFIQSPDLTPSPIHEIGRYRGPVGSTVFSAWAIAYATNPGSYTTKIEPLTGASPIFLTDLKYFEIVP